METVIQLAKRKNLTFIQKVVIAILFIGVCIRGCYRSMNEYFGIESMSDKVWFYGFISFCSFVGMIALVVPKIN